MRIPAIIVLLLTTSVASAREVECVVYDQSGTLSMPADMTGVVYRIRFGDGDRTMSTDKLSLPCVTLEKTGRIVCQEENLQQVFVLDRNGDLQIQAGYGQVIMDAKCRKPK